MNLIKGRPFTFVIGVLFTIVLIFYNIFIINLSSYLLEEKVKDRRMLLDLLCDLAESGGERSVLVEAIAEIDGMGGRGTYCAIFDADLNIMSDRSQLFVPFNPLDKQDFSREVKINHTHGEMDIWYDEGNAPAHTLHMYFRWIDVDSELAVAIIGVSKFSIETDIDYGLRVGAWLISGAFTITGFSSLIVGWKRRRANV